MSEPRTILYVEDEENDFVLLKRAFRTANRPEQLVNIANGTEAMEFLRSSELAADRVPEGWPALVILDINLPGFSGFELLEYVRSRPELNGVPVILFTSSDHPSDRERATQLKADGYYVKPGNLTGYAEFVRAAGAFLEK